MAPDDSWIKAKQTNCPDIMAEFFHEQIRHHKSVVRKLVRYILQNQVEFPITAEQQQQLFDDHRRQRMPSPQRVPFVYDENPFTWEDGDNDQPQHQLAEQPSENANNMVEEQQAQQQTEEGIQRSHQQQPEYADDMNMGIELEHDDGFAPIVDARDGEPGSSGLSNVRAVDDDPAAGLSGSPSHQQVNPPAVADGIIVKFETKDDALRIRPPILVNKKWKCMICNAGQFRDSYAIGRHISNNHCVPCIRCNLCRTTFSHADSLQCHMRQVHRT